MSETIADRIRYLMDLHGWSARKLSSLAGLRSASHVGAILNGMKPTVETIAAIAQAGKVSFTWLATGTRDVSRVVDEDAPDPLASRTNDRDETEPFPKELVSAMGAKALSPATRAALRHTPRVAASEDEWGVYIHLLEYAGQWLEDTALTGKARNAGTGAADVARVAKAQTGAKGRR